MLKKKQLGGLSVELFCFSFIKYKMFVRLLKESNHDDRSGLPNWLKKRAEITPNRTTIELKKMTLVFPNSDQMVEDMARKLVAKGVQAGDTGAILLRNHVDSVVIIHALFYLGARIVMLNSKLTEY